MKCDPSRYMVFGAVAAAALVVGLAETADAQSTWDAGGDGVNWSDPANWDPDGVPTSTTDVLLDTGASVQLDVAATTADLTLDDATVGGPGDLDVTGHLSWGAGTVEGDGVLTVTGGLTFEEGPDKIIGRQVEVQSDALYLHSNIYYDIDNGGAIHYHPGTTLTIDDGEGRGGSGSAGNRDAGTRNAGTRGAGIRDAAIADAAIRDTGLSSMRASHREAPLIGSDGTADATDIYIVEIEGTVLSNTTIMRDVSTRVNGDYFQNGPNNVFGSGSQFTLSSNYVLGSGSQVLFGGGTHLMQGPLTESQVGTSVGGRTLGTQTVFSMGEDFYAFVPFQTAGMHEITSDVNFSSWTVEAGQPAEICGDATLSADDLIVRDVLTVNQARLRTALTNLFSANITLNGGASIDADEMVIDQDQSGLAIFGEADPEDLEEIRIREELTVLQTGNPPLRIMTPLIIEDGAESTLNAGSEIQVFTVAEVSGTVTMKGDAKITARAGGCVFINDTVQIRGEQDPANPDDRPKLELQGMSKMVAANVSPSQFQGVDVTLQGGLEASGANDFGNDCEIKVDGGTLQGPGEVAGKFSFDPNSSVVRATLVEMLLRAKDGSRWNNGHIDLTNGSRIVVPEDSEFTCNQSASGLSITDDGNAAQEERLECFGKFTVDTTAGTGAILDCPSRIDGTFSCLPNTNVTNRDPMDIFGRLVVGENGEYRVIFNTSTVHPGGEVTGNGRVEEAINGDLIINGRIRVSPDGSLEWDGEIEETPTIHLECPRTNENEAALSVNGFCQAPSKMVFEYEEQQEGGDITFKVLDAGIYAGNVGEVVVDGSFTIIQVDETTPCIQANGSTDPGTTTAFGVVFVDRDGSEFPDNGEGLAGVTVELQDVIGTVIATDVTDEEGFYRFNGPYFGEFRIVMGDVNVDGIRLEQPTTGVIGIELLLAGDGFGDLFFRHVLDPTVVAVNSAADDGPGTVRQAILDANADSESRYVALDVSNIAGQVIEVLSPLPKLTRPTQIVAEEQTLLVQGGNGPNLTLDGSQCTDCDGLVLAGGESIVIGLTIQNFDGHGLVLEDLGDNVIVGNTITANASGGIRIRSGSVDRIGSPSSTTPNQIFGNGGSGITVLDGKRHTMRNNSIYANAGPAMDLSGDGVTENDTRDLDAGPNDLLNTPIVTDQDPWGFSVSGTIESRPVSDYIIEIYGSEACPVEGTADIQQLIGVGVVTTDVDGLASFTIETEPYAGELSAIAIDADGSTSEVSPCFSSVVTGVEEPVVSNFVCTAGPNPTTGPSYIRFALPSSQMVEASVYDVSGRKVRTLVRESMASGWHEVDWDGTDDRGRPLARGLYFYQVRTEEHTGSGRIVRVR